MGDRHSNSGPENTAAVRKVGLRHVATPYHPSGKKSSAKPPLPLDRVDSVVSDFTQDGDNDIVMNRLKSGLIKDLTEAARKLQLEGHQQSRHLAGAPDLCAAHNASFSIYATHFVLGAFLIMPFLLVLLYVFKARFTSEPRMKSDRSRTDSMNFEYESEPYFDHLGREIL